MSDTKTALVTGASRGIGFVVATKLAEAGFNLAICGTTQATIDKAAEKIRTSCGVEVLAKAVDVSDRDQIQGFVQETAKHFGRLDVLVNNAGITRDNLSMRMKPDEWDAVIDTNLSSVFNAMQAALKPMKIGRAHV